MKRLHTRVVALALVTLLAAACGDDDAGGTTTSSPSATTTTAAAAATTTTAPQDVTAAPSRAYECADLISDAEIKAAFGPTASFFSQQLWEDTPGAPEGQTYCQYFAEAAAISIAFSVLTGPSFEVFLELTSTPGALPLEGIGDFAVIAPDGTAAGAQVGGTGVTLAVIDLGGSGFGDIDVRAAVIAILELVMSRV